jgi:Xaa-Pro aminopeptidase
VDKISKKNQIMQNKIKALIKKFNEYNIDGYIVPKNDEFFSEYTNKDRLNFISGFNGSAGLAIITLKKNYLFVDGRYTLQAKQQSGKKFKIIEIHKYLPKNIIKNLRLGFDPHLFTKRNLNSLFGNLIKLTSIEKNLVDKIYKKKLPEQKQFFSLGKKSVGESHNSKIKRVSNILNVKKVDYLFISSPENVAWLMNIRGYDSPTSPLPNCRLIIDKNKKIFLFANKKTVQKIIKEKKLKFNQIINPKNFENFIKKLVGNKFAIDPLTCSIFNENIIKSNFKITKMEDPCYMLKSIKNKTEINHTINAHIEDGLALTKFIYWIKKINKKQITEIQAKNKLEKFRKLNKNYLFPSFDTIAGTGSNGAIVHYKVSNKSNKIIKNNDLFLCDSGGQYKFGTTDVTRTLCFSKQKKEIKDVFTKVLKGHIAVYQTNLKKDNTGKKIDLRARKFLKKDGLDYAHGTGHGVGFFLNVHEGPQSISRFNSIALKEGMILSNEPGYYKKDRYGIRIENLVYIKKFRNNLYFQNLTLAPLENDLISFNLLNKSEKDYLFKYHLKIYETYSKFLSLKERKWLASLI